MKYTSLIDNVSSLKWKLSLPEAYLFSWLYNVPSWAACTRIGSQDFYFASKNKAIKDLPILTDKVDTMYRYYKSLEEKGLIIVKKVDGMDYISLTEKGKQWNTSEPSDENPSKEQNNSDENPTNTIISNIDTIISLKENNLKEKIRKTPYQIYVDKNKNTLTALTGHLPKGEREIIVEWLKYKFEVKKGYKSLHWLTGFINDLKEFGLEEMKRSVNEAIKREYEGYFPKKPYSKEDKKQEPPKYTISKGVKRD